MKEKLRNKWWMIAILVFVPLIAFKAIQNTSNLKAQDHKLTQVPRFSSQGLDTKTLKTQTYSLDTFKGKWIVMEWFNNQCPFVEKHYGTGNMQALQKKYTDKGVVWLTVGSSKEGKQGFIGPDLDKKTNKPTTKRLEGIIKDRKPHSTAFLFDSSGKIAREFGATATPHMFVIDPNGNIVYQGAIDDQSSFRKSTVEGARNFVAEALDISLGIDDKKRKKIEVSQFPVYGCGIKNDLKPAA